MLAILLSAAAAPVFVYRRRWHGPVLAVSSGRLLAGASPSGAAANESARAVQAPGENGPATAPAAAATSLVGLGRGALVIGYVTQPLMAGRDGQRAPERDIEGACSRAGWQLVDIVRERQNGRILDRPRLSQTLERIAAGEADALVVNDVRSLSRAPDFGSFVQWFRHSEATLIALDLRLDTSTPEGERMAGALIALNGWANEWLATGTHPSADNGRARSRDRRRAPLSRRPHVLERIDEMDASGMTAQQIADQLNAEHVPTLFGTDRWRPSSIQAALRYRRTSSANRRTRRPAEGE